MAVILCEYLGEGIMLFNYKAYAQSGEIVSGSVDVDNLEMLRKSIKEQGLFLIDATAQRESIGLGLGRTKFNKKDLTIFCKQIAAMLTAGVPLIRSLDILYQQSTKESVRKVVQKLYEDVQKGDMFSDALRKQEGIFPPLMMAMVESGEASGNLEKAMERLSNQFEADMKIENKVKSAMIYPSVVAFVAIAAVVVLLIFVFPTFVAMYEGTEVDLPGITQLLLNISGALVSFWFIIFPVIFAIIFGIGAYFRTESGIRVKDRLKLRLPIIKGVTYKVCAARFTRATGSLVGSGIALLNALDITSRVVNNTVKAKNVEDIREDVRAGISLSAAVKKSEAFPPILHSMISIGEESGNLDGMLEKVSEYLDEEVNTSLTRLMSMLEPMMILVVAVMVGFIVIAMLLPIFGLMEVIQA
jgi:type IV pilus assembly protein PilC